MVTHKLRPAKQSDTPPGTRLNLFYTEEGQRVFRKNNMQGFRVDALLNFEYTPMRLSSVRYRCAKGRKQAIWGLSGLSIYDIVAGTGATPASLFGWWDTRPNTYQG